MSQGRELLTVTAKREDTGKIRGKAPRVQSVWVWSHTALAWWPGECSMLHLVLIQSESSYFSSWSLSTDQLSPSLHPDSPLAG